jgi:quercetin dioxygenase-like cupin family protein
MRSLILSAVFAGGLALGVLLAHAAAPASVVHMEDAEARMPASAKAKITFLARGDNAFVGKLELDGGGKVPVHRDATEEYIHVLKGTGTISIDGVEHALKPGSTVFMPANAEVHYTNGPDRLEAIQVFAGPEPATKYDGWGPAQK